MSESVFSSGMRGAIPDALEDPGRVIALGPGLNGTVWLYHTNRAVHLDHNALRDLLFLRNTAVIYDAGGTVVLSPSGSDGIAIRLPSRLLYIIPRAALADAARGLTRSRFDPMPSV
jgi:hypothetical protein